jgi:CRP-like cAMP-binding protein
MTQGVVLSGSLEFLNLGELLQLLGNNGATGILRIISKYAKEPGLIYIDNGDPVDASSGDRTGLDALYALFGWTEGEFHFNHEAVDRKNVINKNRMEIILDGSRMVDDGKIEKLGPVSFKKSPTDGAGEKRALPVIKGPFVDYMYVVDEEEFYEGDDIVVEGSFGNWMWVILEGSVEISKTCDKGVLKLLRLSEGAFVGSIGSFLLENSVRNATATAASRVQLGMLDSQRLASEFAAISPEMRAVLLSMDNRLKMITDNVARIYANNGQAESILQSKKPVIEQGKNEERAFTINRGSVALARKTESGVVPLLEIGKGDFFGYIPFLKMGHEPFSAAVLASKDLKIAPLDVKALQKEHQALSSSFRNVVENLATCISVTTLIACEYHKNVKKTKAAPA